MGIVIHKVQLFHQRECDHVRCLPSMTSTRMDKTYNGNSLALHISHYRKELLFLYIVYLPYNEIQSSDFPICGTSVIIVVVFNHRLRINFHRGGYQLVGFEESELYTGLSLRI